jgi:hypothetical protein
MNVSFVVETTPVVLTVLMYQMVIIWKIIAVHVTVIVVMTVYRIVLVIGVAILPMMNAVFVVVMTPHVQIVQEFQMVTAGQVTVDA